MYFKKFPKVLYPYTINNETEYRVVTDVTRNVRVMKEILSNITLYDYYVMKDGDTPEIIASKFYGSPQYHWIVMLVNERYDYVDDFPLPYYEFEKYIAAKYGYLTVSYTTDATHTDIDADVIAYQHEFSTGDKVEYTVEGGNQIGGLISGKNYYIIKISNQVFRLASSAINANNGVYIDLTSIGSGIHYFKMNNKTNIHHYEDDKGYAVNSSYINFDGVLTAGIPVTNYEYENRLNEYKRIIKLISPDLVPTVISQFNSII